MRLQAAITIGLAVLATVSSTGPASAQTRSAGAGISVERYSFGEAAETGIESLTLLTLPFRAGAAVTPRLGFEINGAFARGSLTRPDGTESAISGLADTDVRIRYALITDRLILSAAWVAPTGQATQTADESEVAGAVAADLLPFRISNWGSGGGIAADAALLSRIGTTGVGLSVSYGIAGEFEPLEGDETTYLPGNQVQVRVALDRSVGNSGKATLQVSAHRFSDDQLDGRNLYRSGNRIQGMLSYAFAMGRRSSAVTYGGWIRRQRGSYLDPDAQVAGDPAAQDLILVGGGLRIPIRSGAILPAADLRVFRSDDGVGQGFVGGVGVTGQFTTGVLSVAPSVRARFGRILVREGSESPITGIELGLALRVGS